MANISLDYMSPSTYVEYPFLFSDRERYQEKDGWAHVVQSFVRNKIFFKFTINGNPADDGVPNFFDCMMDEIMMFCDKNIKGLWSHDADIGSDGDRDPSEPIEIKLCIMFEKREDLDLFVKDCALLLRLRN
jgi:hypothetical protein